MAALTKAVRLTGTIANISKLFNSLSLSVNSPIVLPSVSTLPRISSKCSYSTKTEALPPPDPLMEFFDDKKNWGEKVVKHGRSWSKDELRIKSNEDLHKLWYILLKERNMLMTMEEACKNAYEYFPSPERIDKVQDSMENLEAVVRERNQAYHYLETGEHGERPTEFVRSQIGLPQMYRHSQHVIPKFLNTTWRKKHRFGGGGYGVIKFLAKYNEKKRLVEQKRKKRNEKSVKFIFRRFPNVDIEAVKEKYPDVNIEKARACSSAQPHYVPPEEDPLR